MFRQERNSSTLLFASLVNRVFGVKRDQDDFDLKNAMTTRSFFQKYPRLYNKIGLELDAAVERLSAGIVCPEEAGLYPVLVILAKLCPAPIVTGNDQFKVSYSAMQLWLLSFSLKVLISRFLSAARRHFRSFC